MENCASRQPYIVQSDNYQSLRMDQTEDRHFLPQQIPPPTRHVGHSMEIRRLDRFRIDRNTLCPHSESKYFCLYDMTEVQTGNTSPDNENTAAKHYPCRWAELVLALHPRDIYCQKRLWRKRCAPSLKVTTSTSFEPRYWASSFICLANSASQIGDHPSFNVPMP